MDGPAPILATPATAVQVTSPTPAALPPTTVRRSTKIAARPLSGVSSTLAAQTLMARRLGSLPPAAPFDDETREAYIKLFKEPLSDQAIAAIGSLVAKVRSSSLAVLPWCGSLPAYNGDNGSFPIPGGWIFEVAVLEFRALTANARASIVCLQETKLQLVSRTDVINILGADFADDFGFLPADGTRGGILLAASQRLFSLSNFSCTANTISTTVTWRADGSSWNISGVYGPQGEGQKELWDLATTQGASWLAIGDFNLIYKATDKNNLLLN
ncbi:hypothetical protein BRADI_2g32722v3 [Brachypodium distachyon]|uniref:Endonuclease/exonuclease/phosphatase domain-containing protein n=1 Tax=Brachypodium distachyon TaxID=15368 RepID=A0A2K2DBI2_BRADI|nr:hypothetical protein BRADI_2g32722v3 [Brachypodium distachyon]